MSNLQRNNTKKQHPVMIRWVFLLLGFVFVGIGLIGVIVPGLPTTVFILLAGWCWAKSSDRFYNWLINHKIFGKLLLDWQERRAMPRYAKILAWSMMAFSNALLFYKMSDKIWLPIISSTICLGVGLWMAKLPDA